jgi:CO/xanthine dehydrogenase Mo-binding subunit
MIQTLKDYIEELKKKLRWWERRDNRRTRTGDKWRGQLIANQITPVPEDWPEDEDEQ